MSTWEAMRSGGLVREAVPIRDLTTYKLGGPARWFCEPGSIHSMKKVVRAARRRGIEILVLGRGSNLVVSDRGFDGLVLRLGGEFRNLEIDGRCGGVIAGAAVALPRLARHASREGLRGLEFYVGIPGSVGGAVTMNAGFFGSETADVLVSASVMDMASGSVVNRSAAGLDLEYRSSGIKSTDMVLDARFAVTSGAPGKAAELMREAIRWRRSHQPGGTLNAGSVFRNPPGDAAGRIIDSLGMKGMAKGGARVSFRHANFFVASPGTTAQDIYDLVHEVRWRVHERTGIMLEPEIRFAGRFDARPPADRNGTGSGSGG